MLKHRLISGSVLIGVLVAITFWKATPAAFLFLAFGLSMMVLGLREFFAVTKRLDAPGFPRLTILASLALALGPAAQCLAPPDTSPSFWLLWDYLVVAIFVIACFTQVFRANKPATGVRNFLASAGAFLYLGVPLTFLARLYFWGGTPLGNGSYFFFYLVLVTKFGDIGGYTVGKLSSKRAGGNHKMVPRLSPGKSWEGLSGSILFSVGIAVFLSWILGEHLMINGDAPLTVARSVLVGVFLACLGLISDLTESVLKRAADIKDSGHTLPGLGGALDTIDSLILVAPVYYCYLLFVQMS